MVCRWYACIIMLLCIMLIRFLRWVFDKVVFSLHIVTGYFCLIILSLRCVAFLFHARKTSCEGVIYPLTHCFLLTISTENNWPLKYLLLIFIFRGKESVIKIHFHWKQLTTQVSAPHIHIQWKEKCNKDCCLNCDETNLTFASSSNFWALIANSK